MALIIRFISGLMGAFIGGVAGLAIALIIGSRSPDLFAPLVIAGLALRFVITFLGGEKAMKALGKITMWIP